MAIRNLENIWHPLQLQLVAAYKCFMVTLAEVIFLN